MKPLHERRKELNDRFYFICECIACVNDYPLYANLPRPPTIPPCGEYKFSLFLFKYDDDDVAVAFEMIKKYLNKYDGALAQQILEARSELLICMQALLKNVPISILYKNKF